MVADSLPDTVLVFLLGTLLDLRGAKSGLYGLSASISDVKIDTGLTNLENGIHGIAQQIYQVRTYVLVIIAFGLGVSVSIILIGLTFLLLIHSMRKEE